MIRRHDPAQAFQDAWESGARATGDVAELVRVASTVRASASAAPAPAFRSALRERLMVEAADVLVPAERPVRVVRPEPARPRRARRRIAGVAAASVVSAGFVGMVATSAQALPGDALYPVKRGVETVELALHRDDAGRGGYRLELATERLSEARAVLERPGGAAEVPTLLDEFTTQAEQGSAQLFDSFGQRAASGDVERVNDFTAAAALDLSDMSSEVPDDAAAAFESATSLVTDLAGQAARLCGQCSTPDVSGLRHAVEQVLGTPQAASSSAADDEGPAETADRPAASGTATPSTRQTAGTPSPTPTGTVPSPTLPTPTPSPSPSQRGLLGGVVTGLLGDEETEGLVPGLIGGLLGTNQTAPPR